jgi:hypothetical protein
MDSGRTLLVFLNMIDIVTSNVVCDATILFIVT